MTQKIIFTEKNIYILSKLVALLRIETGERHRLTTNQTITHLLISASRSSNEGTIDYFHRFLENLTPEQLLEFRDYGLNIPSEYMRKPGFLPSPITRQYAYTPR